MKKIWYSIAEKEVKQMAIAGIITEYNPFHHGHEYHIQETRRITNCDVLIAVMSGNFVQRGEPAIIHKWKRAEYALQHGVDLVLELPYPFVVQRADRFADASVRILQMAGVEHIVFGSETNDVNYLQSLAQVDPNPRVIHQAKGVSYPKAMNQDQLSSNDILGVAYMRALTKTNIHVSTIQRTNTYHDVSLDTAIASASAIRNGIAQHQSISHTTRMAHELDNTFLMEQYYPLIQTLLTTLPVDYLKQIFLMDEGIEQLFRKEATKQMDWSSFIDHCISKRYTRSKIQRTLLHLLTQTRKEEIDNLPPLNYLRVLGFNDNGKKHLRRLQEQQVCVTSRFNQIPIPYRDIEYRASCAYASVLPLTKRKEMMALELRPPIYLPL